MLEELESCKLCPHMCQVNRIIGRIGRFKSNLNIKLGLYSTHNFE